LKIKYLTIYIYIILYLYRCTRRRYWITKRTTTKYFFDELTCHYYLFDGLEFFTYNNNISNKHVRHARTYILNCYSNNLCFSITFRLLYLYILYYIYMTCAYIAILRRTIIYYSPVAVSYILAFFQQVAAVCGGPRLFTFFTAAAFYYVPTRKYEFIFYSLFY